MSTHKLENGIRKKKKNVIRFVTWLFYDTVSHAEAMT
jgi:hypothetical protein